MKNALVCLILISAASTANANPMSRVIGVRDSHTLVVTTNAVTSTVELKNVSIAPDEESDAVAYLRLLVSNAWVYIDNGDVYRSPDALYVNGEMSHHPWHTMKILGQIDLGVRAKGEPIGNKVTAPTLPAPQRFTPESRGTRASRSGSRRGARSR